MDENALGLEELRNQDILVIATESLGRGRGWA
jgi:hypothetical protein